MADLYLIEVELDAAYKALTAIMESEDAPPMVRNDAGFALEYVRAMGQALHAAQYPIPEKWKGGLPRLRAPSTYDYKDGHEDKAPWSS